MIYVCPDTLVSLAYWPNPCRLRDDTGQSGAPKHQRNRNLRKYNFLIAPEHLVILEKEPNNPHTVIVETDDDHVHNELDPTN